MGSTGQGGQSFHLLMQRFARGMASPKGSGEE